MINKAILKQSIKSNYVLWLVITIVLTLILCLISGLYNPATTASILEAIADTPIADFAGDKLAGMTSLLGSLSQSVYSMMAVILLIVFFIITGNNLIAGEIDKGSMAYTLSTPIKRKNVVMTKGFFLIISILASCLVFMTAGIITIQAKHGAVWGINYTQDVIAISEKTEYEKNELAEDLKIVIKDNNFIKIGAEARKLDEDVYILYLNLKIEEHALKTAAEILEVTYETVKEDLSLILNNTEALTAAANDMGMDNLSYTIYLNQTIDMKAIIDAQKDEMQNKMVDAFKAAAEVLDISVSKLSENLTQILKNPEALKKGAEAAKMDEALFTTMIKSAAAANAFNADIGVEFDLGHFLLLNLGLFLLIFALSGISFLASCWFNLSKHSFAIGAGVPLLFWILNMLAQLNDSLEVMKYFTLNTLYNPSNIIKGENYIIPFIILAFVGVILYAVGIEIFKRKDLPL